MSGLPLATAPPRWLGRGAGDGAGRCPDRWVCADNAGRETWAARVGCAAGCVPPSGGDGTDRRGTRGRAGLRGSGGAAGLPLCHRCRLVSAPPRPAAPSCGGRDHFSAAARCDTAVAQPSGGRFRGGAGPGAGGGGLAPVTGRLAGRAGAFVRCRAASRRGAGARGGNGRRNKWLARISRAPVPRVAAPRAGSGSRAASALPRAGRGRRRLVPPPVRPAGQRACGPSAAAAAPPAPGGPRAVERLLLCGVPPDGIGLRLKPGEFLNVSFPTESS